MKSDELKMAGNVHQSDPDRMTMRRTSALLLVLAFACCASAGAQDLYKYQDADGNWIFSDRPPEDGQTAESRELEVTQSEEGAVVDVTHSHLGRTVLLTARNDFFAPVELRLEITESESLELPGSDHPMTWVLPPQSTTNLLQLTILEGGEDPFLEYGFRYMPGDPRATHEAPRPYRAPFAKSSDHRVTQAFPDKITHAAADSYYAVDIAMPVGTDIVAARDGVVFDIASKNYRSGQSAEEDGPAANVVRILHDDGTYAIYAHLNTNTIRVRPGDVVERGQYIADSGNTGFSSGPHLHFAVVRNVGLRVESVPIEFLGVNSQSVTAAAGEFLAAY